MLVNVLLVLVLQWVKVSHAVQPRQLVAAWIAAKRRLHLQPEIGGLLRYRSGLVVLPVGASAVHCVVACILSAGVLRRGIRGVVAAGVVVTRELKLMLLLLLLRMGAGDVEGEEITDRAFGLEHGWDPLVAVDGWE